MLADGKGIAYVQGDAQLRAADFFAQRQQFPRAQILVVFNTHRNTVLLGEWHDFFEGLDQGFDVSPHPLGTILGAVAFEEAADGGAHGAGTGLVRGLNGLAQRRDVCGVVVAARVQKQIETSARLGKNRPLLGRAVAQPLGCEFDAVKALVLSQARQALGGVGIHGATGLAVDAGKAPSAEANFHARLVSVNWSRGTFCSTPVDRVLIRT